MARLPPASLAWLTWGLLASLYFVGFFQRVAPAVMVDELMFCARYHGVRTL